MRHGPAVAVALLSVAAGAAGAGVYDPQPGAYGPEQDPKTVVRAGAGVGSVRLGQRIATVSERDFGPVRRRATIPARPGRPRGWIVRVYGGIRIIARADGAKRIVGFVLESPGFQTREGLGVGDRLRGARVLFGPATRLSARRGTVLWRLGATRAPVLVRTDDRGRIQTWAIAADALLPAAPTLR